jgi:hypothetical protein
VRDRGRYATGWTNPRIDYHFVSAAVVVVLALVYAGHT